MKTQLEGKYEIQTQRIGTGAGREPEGKILNRIVRWTADGYEIEADPRHSELVIQQLGLEGAKPLSSPGVDGKEEEDIEGDVPLGAEQATRYRGIAARINYLASDRPDVQYSVKEACRDMSTLSTGSWTRLERIGKYLLGRPRLIWKFALQSAIECVDAFSDANWAGCRHSRIAVDDRFSEKRGGDAWISRGTNQKSVRGALSSRRAACRGGLPIRTACRPSDAR